MHTKQWTEHAVFFLLLVIAITYCTCTLYFTGVDFYAMIRRVSNRSFRKIPARCRRGALYLDPSSSVRLVQLGTKIHVLQPLLQLCYDGAVVVYFVFKNIKSLSIWLAILTFNFYFLVESLLTYIFVFRLFCCGRMCLVPLKMNIVSFMLLTVVHLVFVVSF